MPKLYVWYILYVVFPLVCHNGTPMAFPSPQVAEVEADLELIVSNAMTFNATTDPVHRYALELQAVFRSELPLIKRALAGSERREEGDAKKPRVR